MSSVGVFHNYSIKYYTWFDCTFVVYLVVNSCFFIMQNFSMAFNIFPLVVVYITSIIFSVGLMECLLSKRCCANLNLLFAYFYNCENVLWTLCEMVNLFVLYFLLQSGYVNWYTPSFSNFFWWQLFCLDSSLPIVFCVVKAIFRAVFLKSVLINFVSLPTYVNLAYLVFCFIFCCGEFV